MSLEWNTPDRSRGLSRAPMPPPRARRGFSIVEALIALVILSVGMLGIAALYIESLRASRSALYRTRAVTLTTDMADRIRADRGTGASKEELARWLTTIRSNLPGDGASTPSGSVVVDAARIPARYTITVTWSEPGEPQPLSYVLNLQMM